MDFRNWVAIVYRELTFFGKFQGHIPAMGHHILVILIETKNCVCYERNTL